RAHVERDAAASRAAQPGPLDRRGKRDVAADVLRGNRVERDPRIHLLDGQRLRGGCGGGAVVVIAAVVGRHVVDACCEGRADWGGDVELGAAARGATAVAGEVARTDGYLAGGGGTGN